MKKEQIRMCMLAVLQQALQSSQCPTRLHTSRLTQKETLCILNMRPIADLLPNFFPSWKDKMAGERHPLFNIYDLRIQNDLVGFLSFVCGSKNGLIRWDNRIRYAYYILAMCKPRYYNILCLYIFMVFCD